jgi:hypothetical protein
MALTVTTDLVRITDAETATGWSTYGSGGAGALALEPDFFVQNANCISRGVSGAVIKGMTFDIGAGNTLDFNSGTHQDKLVYVWMRTSTPGLCETIANGGIRVVLGSGTTAPADAAGVWSAWYVDGSNTLGANNGWTCYVVDPQSTASTTFGGGVDVNAIRWFGGVQRSTGTLKGQNFGIDAIYYGRGELRVTGTVTTAGKGFSEISAIDWGNTANRYGIITEKGGIFFVRGKIVIGHATSNTTFSSYSETVVWETPHYYSGGIIRSVPNASVGSVTGSDGKTSYNGLGIIGGSGTTTIDFGQIVGSDGGRSGPLLSCPYSTVLGTPAATLATVSVDSSTMSLKIYGTTFSGFEGAIDLQGTGVDDDDCFGNTFTGCGRIDSNMEIRNCNILNSVASTTDGAYIWNSTTNLEKCLFANNSRAIVYEATTGTPFTYTSITFSGNTFDIRNESGGAITVNVSGGTTPTKEDIGGGSATTISSSVPVTVTVVDKDDVPISAAQVAIYVGATQVANTDTNGSGVVSTSYTGSVPANATWKVRKSSPAKNSIKFNAHADRLQSDSPPTGSTLTIGGWVYIDVDTNYWTTLFYLGNSADTDWAAFGTDSDGLILKAFDSGFGGAYLQAGTLTVGEWHFVSMGWNGTNTRVTFAKIGDPLAEATYAHSPAIVSVSKLILGSNPTDELLNGRMAGWKVWDGEYKTLTQMQAEMDMFEPASSVDAFYAFQNTSTMLLDSSGNTDAPNNLTNPGGAGSWTQETGPVFSGATRYIANSGPAVIAAGTGMTVKVVLQQDTTAGA